MEAGPSSASIVKEVNRPTVYHRTTPARIARPERPARGGGHFALIASQESTVVSANTIARIANLESSIQLWHKTLVPCATLESTRTMWGRSTARIATRARSRTPPCLATRERPPARVAQLRHTRTTSANLLATLSTRLHEHVKAPMLERQNSTPALLAPRPRTQVKARRFASPVRPVLFLLQIVV
jgi:hypothetical protein